MSQLGQWLTILRNEGFPDVNDQNCRLTSPVDEGYNCIAWAAEDATKWWWPDAQQQAYWPDAVPRELTLAAFRAAYGLLGYTTIADDTVEPCLDKVAIFVRTSDVPTHAARQLADGWWASKLGREIDIEHRLRAIEGPAYGTVGVILSRPYGVLR